MENGTKVKWKESKVVGSFNSGKLKTVERRGEVKLEQNGLCFVKPEDGVKLVMVETSRLTVIK